MSSNHPLPDLALRLIEERTRLGFSQAELARLTGMSRESIRLYEAGERGMRAQFLTNCIEVGVNVMYVLTGVGRAKGVA